MTSKHPNQSSRRYPLKRVRPDNENQGSIISSNGRNSKKFCREPSEDSAYVEIEKSSDERAFDLFYKEYFSQFRPYFKNHPIAVQFVEHLWKNMMESSKVAFVRKVLKEQGNYDHSTTDYNDENDSQLNKSLNESNRNISILNYDNKYSRSFINDFLSYLKHYIIPRFTNSNSSLKLNAPLRRSSRIRRAPVKCACSTCVTTGAIEEHSSSSSSSLSNDDLQNKIFRQLISEYHQLDDDYNINKLNSSITIDNNEQIKLNETNDNSQIEMPLSEIIEREIPIESSPSIIPIVSINSNDVSLPSFDFLINPSTVSNDNNPLVTTDSLSTTEYPTRRTYVILTELDEPFFGPYPIEFTITI